MSVSNMFKNFLDNLKVDNAEQISLRYGEITASLNKKFRDTDSKESNSLKVGSYGRYTGIKGISDLDMLYIMPKNTWETYKDNQSKLLTDVKDAIKARYPNTNIRVDRLVVTVTYVNFHIEVQPVFEIYEEEDTYFKYPDTYKGGSWKKTKPRDEIKEIKELNDKKNGNLRLLCKMVRAWKNKHGVSIGGLLIDTLVYNFMRYNSDFDDKSYHHFDWLSRDFFKFLSEEPNKVYYRAPGSNQNVKVKNKFQKQAKKAYEFCLQAINAENTNAVNDKWRKVYGRHFPAKQVIQESIATATRTWKNTEEFIEDIHAVDIQYNIGLDCDVSQNGFREYTLANMLARRIPLRTNKKLLFRVVECDVPGDFILKWKVLNQGLEAERRDCVRGQIEIDNGYKEKNEVTNFKGAHIVECFAIKNGIVVARAEIDVPIQ
ncbi:SMODS domain-containing nucleotidyltransferase [Xenorhabdus bovienii]|uniref:SMODS domain-containing nucleotidyltransferase n=1 Tax=Xenorhabdus bovienii TaxID=40576 RepID=UPI0023B2618E|nr:nucleotidyltransferase [Xenorhabdus bovienii]MDE9553041.1 nucleotidyltransferase [Xenorhabdus bovienii]